MEKKLKVLVVGCGNMGKSHARAYHRLETFEIVGLVSRGPASREALSQELTIAIDSGLEDYNMNWIFTPNFQKLFMHI